MSAETDPTPTSDSDPLAVAALRLRLALARAIEVGADVEEALRPIVLPPEPPPQKNWPLVGPLVARWQRRPLPPPSAEQIRRCCDHLDGFVAALGDVDQHRHDDHPTGPAASADQASESGPASWSHRLWESNANAPHVYNEVRSTLAGLNRLRVELILDRGTSHPTD